MDTDANKKVQKRLLDAAERLFSEKGFEGTSIRQLTTAAKCNIAAVNYYFGGKDKLYVEVFHRRMVALREMRVRSINEVMNSTEATLENLLHAFATAFIEPLLDESGGRRFVKLMTREMLNRHLPANMLLEETVIPVFSTLQQALLKLFPYLDRTKAVQSIHSIIAQLIHAIRVKEMFSENTNIELPAFDLAQTVEHIVAFSAAGIRASVRGDCQ